MAVAVVWWMFVFIVLHCWIDIDMSVHMHAASDQQSSVVIVAASGLPLFFFVQGCFLLLFIGKMMNLYPA